MYFIRADARLCAVEGFSNGVSKKVFDFQPQTFLCFKKKEIPYNMQRLLLFTTLLYIAQSTFCGGVCPAEWYAFGLCGWLCGSEVFHGSVSQEQQQKEGLLPPTDVITNYPEPKCPPGPSTVADCLWNKTTPLEHYDRPGQDPETCEVCDLCDTCEACDKALCLRSELVYNPLNETLAQNLFTLVALYNIRDVAMALARICKV